MRTPVNRISAASDLGERDRDGLGFQAPNLPDAAVHAGPNTDAPSARRPRGLEPGRACR